MRIGLVTDGLPDLPPPDLLRTAAELGIATLEFGCGNWSSAPHLKLDALLESHRRAQRLPRRSSPRTGWRSAR